MDWLKFCLLIGSFVAFCESSDPYYFVITPNVIRYNHAETVLVSIFGKHKNVQVSVWLQQGDEQFSLKEVIVPSEESPIYTTIRVTESDIFKPGVNEKPRFVQLCSKFRTKLCRDVVISYKTGYIIVQTDKPIYTPKQKVKMRVIALDESLKTVTGDDVTISMDIVSPSNFTLKSRNFGKLKSTAFYQRAFTLPPNPEKGIWTARAFYGGKYETTARSSFQVQEYVLRTFIITIEVSKPYILFSESDDTKVEFIVTARYVYQKAVEGNARLSLNITDEIGDIKNIDLERKELQNGKATFSIEIRDFFKFCSSTGKRFLDGSRLEVVATVLESATGKEESTLNDDTVLATEPYIVKFTRSKRYFSPGMEYYLKIDLFTPNNVHAPGVKIQVQELDDIGQNVQSKEVETDTNGQAFAIFSTKQNERMLFKVTAKGSSTSHAFEALPYDDINQIRVESIIIDHKMQMNAVTNIQLGNYGNSEPCYTGMLYVVLAGGKVIRAVFREASNSANEPIADTLHELITPTARLLVFYVDRTSDRVVADSVKIDADVKCKGARLTLQPERYEVRPRSLTKIKITGIPYSMVGLSAMDKALLPQNDKNILMRSKLFDTFRSHDLGCGGGSGKSNGDVFKNAGLFILTNALISSDLHRFSEECDTETRKKRSVYESTQLTDSVTNVLEDISDYENDLKRLAETGIRPIKRTDIRESVLFEEVQLDVNGEAEREYYLPDSITEWMIQAIGVTENNGLCIADPVNITVFKNVFINVDLPYQAIRFELFDVNVTLFAYDLEVESQANVYLEAMDGLCYGTESGKPSPRKRLDIGPNIARTVNFPVIPLKTGKYLVKVTTIITDLLKIPKVDIIEKPIFVVNEGIQELLTIQVCLDPYQQLEDCQDHDRVTTIKQFDKGIIEQVTEIDLTLPYTAIRGTGSATAYIQGYIIESVVQSVLSGVNTLLLTPAGSVINTIDKTALNVYAMMYLKETKQVTGTIEVTGNTNIMNGVKILKNRFRKSDGSYSYARHTKTTSVWLTSFVVKVFCQANSVTDVGLDVNNDIVPTIIFLLNHMSSAGVITEIEPRVPSYTKGAIGRNTTPSLTAFVLISLLGCIRIQYNVYYQIILARKYLETLDKTWLQSRPFDLAITTYALALVNSDIKWEFRNLLLSIKTKSQENIYWKNPGSSVIDTYSIETTAYGLLAMLKLDDMKNAEYIVRWLTSKKKAQNVFRAIQDTSVGLQALTEYSIRTRTQTVDLKVSLRANNWHTRQYYIKKERFDFKPIVDKLPVESTDNKLHVLVTGTGTGRMRIDLRYNRPAKEGGICPFDLSDIEEGDVYNLPSNQTSIKLGKCDVCGLCVANDPNPDYSSLTTPASSNVGRHNLQATSNRVNYMRCIRFSVRAKPGNQHGKSTIQFNLHTDTTALKEDIEKVFKRNTNIDCYELPTVNREHIVFHLKTLTTYENEFVFRVFDNFNGDENKRKPISVDVFDSHHQDNYCRKVHGVTTNKDEALNYHCDSSKEQCVCLESVCSVPVEAEILKMTEANRRPALKMVKYTCNPDNANFADIVEVVTVSSDKGSKDITAIAKVVTNIHRGRVPHEVGDELNFTWKAICPYPKLQIGKEYLIIAKDGVRVHDKDGNDMYLYSLMKTALVIELKKSRRIKNAIMTYTSWMRNKGCMNK